MENTGCLVDFRNLFNTYLTTSQKRTAKMVFYRNRLKTFSGWPFTEIEDECTPENLAKAGFYSTRVPKRNGNDTSVKCFCCLKELDGWESADVPWEEHKLHQSDCPFIVMNKEESQWTVVDWMHMQHNSVIKLLESSYKKIIQDLEYKLTEKRDKLNKEKKRKR